MKIKIVSRSLVLCAIILLLSCQEDESTSIGNSIEIYATGKETKSIVNKWTSSQGSARINNSFDSNNLLRIVDNQNDSNLFTIPNKNDPSETISFGILRNGTIINAFKAKVSLLSEGKILNEIHSLTGELKFAFVDSQDGSRTMITRNSSITRSEGWWTSFDDCVGVFHSPTKSNTANVAIVAVSDAATLGLYSGLSLVVCAGVASADSWMIEKADLDTHFMGEISVNFGIIKTNNSNITLE